MGVGPIATTASVWASTRPASLGRGAVRDMVLLGDVGVGLGVVGALHDPVDFDAVEGGVVEERPDQGADDGGGLAAGEERCGAQGGGAQQRVDFLRAAGDGLKDGPGLRPVAVAAV